MFGITIDVKVAYRWYVLPVHDGSGDVVVVATERVWVEQTVLVIHACLRVDHMTQFSPACGWIHSVIRI